MENSRSGDYIKLSRRISVRLSQRERDQIELQLKRGKFRNMSQVIRFALKEFLEETEVTTSSSDEVDLLVKLREGAQIFTDSANESFDFLKPAALKKENYCWGRKNISSKT